MKAIIQKWWEGEYIPYDNDPNSFLVFVGGYQKRHWTANAAHWLWEFVKVEWKWVIGFLLTAIGLLMTYIRFF